MAKQKRNGQSMLFSFLKDNRWKYITGILLLFIINILQLIVPRLTGTIIDGIKEGAIGEQALLKYSAIIFIISILVFILNYLSRIQITGSSNLYEFLLRNKMFSHLLDMSMDFYNKRAIGDIMALSTNDIGAIRMAMGRGIMLTANTVFLITASIYIMSTKINPRLTLIAFIPMPALVYVMMRFGRSIHKRSKKVQESFGHLTRKTQENISGIRVIKAFVQEDNEIRNFQELNEEDYEKSMALVRIRGIFFPLIGFISSLSYLVVLVYGGNLVVDGAITLGDFVAFNSYLGMIIRPVRFIGMLINFMQRGKASVDRIDELLDEKPTIYDDPSILKEGFESERFEGKIEFRDLTFRYAEGEEPVLKGIDLIIEPGETVAIVGKVGSGKTTLVNLILRLYNPENRGALFIDDIDIMDIPLEILRQNIGYVPQDNFLFSTTIRDNIAFSPIPIEDRTVKEAASISQVYSEILELPEGFHTTLGERGVNLSGGQKQRVSIARALAKDPSILILDDSLSAVDTDTEERILEGLGQFMKGRTTIIIAHRISTIKDADTIVVLDRGRIVEHGTHEELVAMGGTYSEMYERQLLEDKIAVGEYGK